MTNKILSPPKLEGWTEDWGNLVWVRLTKYGWAEDFPPKDFVERSSLGGDGTVQTVMEPVRRVVET